MADASTAECPNCKRLEARVAQLQDRIARLEKNSSNSHKPPSSDIVKPKKCKAGKGKRRIGGQPGHPRHQRPPFGPDQIDRTRLYTLGQCPDCGGALSPGPKSARVVQQVEPTNNLAEQALRFVVIQRRMTQGTRGAAGRAWCERIWTALATCRQQGRSVYGFLHRALHAHFTGQPAPSLLPA